MCYCCHELCPHKAMDVRRGFIGTMALKTYKFFFGGRKNENNH